VQRDERAIWYTQEHSLPYLSKRNSDEMQIFSVLTDGVFFRIYSWKVPFPKIKTDYSFGYRYQFRILPVHMFT